MMKFTSLLVIKIILHPHDITAFCFFHWIWNLSSFPHGHSSFFMPPPSKPSAKPHLRRPSSHHRQLSGFYCFEFQIQEAIHPQNSFTLSNFFHSKMPTCSIFWKFSNFQTRPSWHSKHQVLVSVLWRWLFHSGASSVWRSHGAWGIHKSTPDVWSLWSEHCLSQPFLLSSST